MVIVSKMGMLQAGCMMKLRAVEIRRILPEKCTTADIHSKYLFLLGAKQEKTKILKRSFKLKILKLKPSESAGCRRNSLSRMLKKSRISYKVMYYTDMHYS